MTKGKQGAERIVRMLKQPEWLSVQGKTMEEMCRMPGISD